MAIPGAAANQTKTSDSVAINLRDSLADALLRFSLDLVKLVESYLTPTKALQIIALLLVDKSSWDEVLKILAKVLKIDDLPALSATLKEESSEWELASLPEKMQLIQNHVELILAARQISSEAILQNFKDYAIAQLWRGLGLNKHLKPAKQQDILQQIKECTNAGPNLKAGTELIWLQKEILLKKKYSYEDLHYITNILLPFLLNCAAFLMQERAPIAAEGEGSLHWIWSLRVESEDTAKGFAPNEWQKLLLAVLNRDDAEYQITEPRNFTLAGKSYRDSLVHRILMTDEWDDENYSAFVNHMIEQMPWVVLNTIVMMSDSLRLDSHAFPYGRVKEHKDEKGEYHDQANSYWMQYFCKRQPGFFTKDSFAPGYRGYKTIEDCLVANNLGSAENLVAKALGFGLKRQSFIGLLDNASLDPRTKAKFLLVLCNVKEELPPAKTTDAKGFDQKDVAEQEDREETVFKANLFELGKHGHVAIVDCLKGGYLEELKGLVEIGLRVGVTAEFFINLIWEHKPQYDLTEVLLLLFEKKPKIPADFFVSPHVGYFAIEMCLRTGDQRAVQLLAFALENKQNHHGLIALVDSVQQEISALLRALTAALEMHNKLQGIFFPETLCFSGLKPPAIQDQIRKFVPQVKPAADVSKLIRQFKNVLNDNTYTDKSHKTAAVQFLINSGDLLSESKDFFAPGHAGSIAVEKNLKILDINNAKRFINAILNLKSVYPQHILDLVRECKLEFNAIRKELEKKAEPFLPFMSRKKILFSELSAELQERASQYFPKRIGIEVIYPSYLATIAETLNEVEKIVLAKMQPALTVPPPPKDDQIKLHFP